MTNHPNRKSKIAAAMSSAWSDIGTYARRFGCSGTLSISTEPVDSDHASRARRYAITHAGEPILGHTIASSDLEALQHFARVARNGQESNDAYWARRIAENFS
jgi:hypothetical protein